MKKFNQIDFSRALGKEESSDGSIRKSITSEDELLTNWLNHLMQRDTEFLTAENIRLIHECFNVDEDGNILYTEKGEKLIVEALDLERSWWEQQYRDSIQS